MCALAIAGAAAFACGQAPWVCVLGNNSTFDRRAAVEQALGAVDRPRSGPTDQRDGGALRVRLRAPGARSSSVVFDGPCGHFLVAVRVLSLLRGIGACIGAVIVMVGGVESVNW